MMEPNGRHVDIALVGWLLTNQPTNQPTNQTNQTANCPADRPTNGLTDWDWVTFMWWNNCVFGCLDWRIDWLPACHDYRPTNWLIGWLFGLNEWLIWFDILSDCCLVCLILSVCLSVCLSICLSIHLLLLLGARWRFRGFSEVSSKTLHFFSVPYIDMFAKTFPLP